MIGTKDIIERIDYDEYSNRDLLIIPGVLALLAVLVIGGYFVVTGSPVILGIEFIGGSELRLAPDQGVESPQDSIESAFTGTPSSIQSVPADGTYIVKFRGEGQDVGELESQAEAAGFTVQSSSEISPTFGADSQRLTVIGMLFALVAVGFLVYGLFRTFVPSVAVILSALSDVLVPIAMMNVLGIEMTLGTVAALLMLVGYSVDSDMLLNDYVVRRGGDFYTQVYAAMDTGVTMTLTSFVAMVIMAVGATILGVPLLQDIGLIIAFGLVVDVLNTYLMNVTLLRWYRFSGVKR